MSSRDVSIRVRRLHQQGAEPDLKRLSPAERIALIWPLTLDAWAFTGFKDAESRLPRHFVRTLRPAR
jgi:hypothetical protein